jgi:hypothetical protein
VTKERHGQGKPVLKGVAEHLTALCGCGGRVITIKVTSCSLLLCVLEEKGTILIITGLNEAPWVYNCL